MEDLVKEIVSSQDKRIQSFLLPFEQCGSPFKRFVWLQELQERLQGHDTLAGMTPCCLKGSKNNYNYNGKSITNPFPF